MSTYKAIKGQQIKIVSSDPSPVALGDVWYNSTSNTVKAYAKSSSWAIDADMTGTNRGTGYSAGTKDAGWIAGGRPGAQTATSEYDGTSYSAGGALNTGSNTGGSAGTGTTGLRAGGNGGGLTCEEYASSTWTAGGAIPSASYPRSSTYGCAGSGTSVDAAWITGGGPGGEGTPGWTTSKQYNGTAWSSTGASDNIRWTAAAAGSEAAGNYFGGYNYASYSSNSEEYNGSTFAEGANMPSSRANLGGTGAQDSAAAIGGSNGAPVYATNTYFIYNGTTWATGSNTPAITAGCVGFGADNTNVICAGGERPGGYSLEGYAYVEADQTVSLTTS